VSALRLGQAAEERGLESVLYEGEMQGVAMGTTI